MKKNSYEQFKLQIYKMTDINLSLYKERQMKRRIESLMKKNNIDNFYDYLVSLKTDKIIFEEFINYITINVSEFYRNPSQWKILEDEFIPFLLSKNKSLKIWSSACSTGEEPYSLVMALSKFLPLSAIKIFATDIDRNIIEKAKAGIYNSKSLDNLPAEYINDFFTKEEGFYKIKDKIKRCVRFSQLNLLKDNYPLACDLIICRNVLIYFTEEAKSQIYSKFNRSLKPHGILFVGSTEQIILPAQYNFVSLKTFFYQKTCNINENKGII